MREIFYSNGVDIFGPVTIEEFSKNRYYKSTLVWYEGMAGWTNIGDCEEFRHLIGTMSTPVLDSSVPHSLPNLTPPLTKKEKPASRKSRRYLAVALILFLLALAFTGYYFNNRMKPSEPVKPALSDTIQASPPVVDSNAMKQAAIVKQAQLEAEKKTYRLNWEKFIIALTNDYKQKEIGGIDDLKMIVKNNSPYKIDNVKLKVMYVKANGDVHQTETMEFDNIDPNTSKELFAPKSERGVKVKWSILSVRSEAMNLCADKTAANYGRDDTEDRYKCR